jgi:hypothetical protein
MVQAASIATITSPTSHWSPCVMGLILFEALGAGSILIILIWWTMFSGRKRGELSDEPEAETPSKPANRDSMNDTN